MLSGGVLNIDRLHALSQIMQTEGDKCIEHGEAYYQDDCKKLGMELKRVAVQVYLVFQQRSSSERAQRQFATEFDALNALVAMESLAPGSTTALNCQPPQHRRPERTPRVICDYSDPEPDPAVSLLTDSASCDDVRRFYRREESMGAAIADRSTCAKFGCESVILDSFPPQHTTRHTAACKQNRLQIALDDEEEKEYGAHLDNLAMYESNGC